ncbi:hypothetical protein EYR40_004830 [Pleurotus pulmonarius]|nr:hypothetical protein EYR36_006790 [Pleurotus pulmonarius]KAF4601484.1 hypothetical protein EYR38_006137 [Pleurotus pulmonarius]KAF4601631.1 hypothetical protein EYR40_004830 [Pleurotus pulmonarius]
MYTNNPYSAWTKGSNFPGGAPPPSVFGALPYSSSAAKAPMVTFTFTFNPSILSCTVTGPQNKIYYRIATDNPTPGFTFVHDGQGKPVVVIEWQSHPIVEIRGIVPKQYACQWLSLSSQRNARHMQVAGKKYVWAPGDGVICLFDTSSGTPELLGKITNGQTRVTLDLTTYAIQGGLTEAAIVSTILLLSGRNID